jgi:RNA polymerase sigma-70 factor (ECF subfamily)
MLADVEALYRRYGPMVLRRCRRMLRDDAKALDAMHDVFVELLRRQATLDLRAPSSFLLQTATHVSLNRLRSERRHPEDRDDALLFAIAGDPALAPENQTATRRLLARVFQREPESTRLIAVLHFVDRMSLQEVADEVGLSVSGVRKRLRTLQARLPLESTEHST